MAISLRREKNEDQKDISGTVAAIFEMALTGVRMMVTYYHHSPVYTDRG